MTETRDPSGEEGSLMALATIPYGVSAGIAVDPVPVDPDALLFDVEQQINFVRHGKTLVPALKHSTGKTSTNTARDDAKAGGDSDTDATED